MAGPRWICQTFDELGVRGLYRALRLRSEVFVIEQRCLYLDPDGLDEHAWHLQGLGQGAGPGGDTLLAYARRWHFEEVKKLGAGRGRTARAGSTKIRRQ